MTDYKITFAMIEAGERVVEDNDLGDGDFTLDVAGIYQAMRRIADADDALEGALAAGLQKEFLTPAAEIVGYEGSLTSVIGTKDIKFTINLEDIPTGTILYLHTPV